MRSQEFIDLLSLGFINVKTISDENLEAELSKGKGIIFYTFDGNNGNVVKCHAFFMKDMSIGCAFCRACVTFTVLIQNHQSPSSSLSL